MPRCRIDLTAPRFCNDLQAAKKAHPSITDDLAEVFSILEEHFDYGPWVPNVGAHVRKIRVGVKQARISKRDGYRLIYHVDLDAARITPLLFHYKPGIALIAPKEIAKAVKEMLLKRDQQTMEIPPSGQTN